MKSYKGRTFSEVYKESLKDLLGSPDFETRPRDMNIRENMNVSLEITDPMYALYRNDRRSSQKKYLAAEFMWYFLGRNDVAWISEYAKFWESIQNPDGTANSAYGDLLFTQKNEVGMSQYEWALNSLIKDKDSRQATMNFNQPKHQYLSNKDFVCTMYANFHIRDNKLYLKVNMRSNDVILGTPTDIAFFCMLQQQMLHHLKALYQDLELGSYTHQADSYHLYERHFDLVRDMISTEWSEERLPTLEMPLIRRNGSPTQSLLDMNNPKVEEIPNDPTYQWINKHIRDEVTV